MKIYSVNSVLSSNLTYQYSVKLFQNKSALEAYTNRLIQDFIQNNTGFNIAVSTVTTLTSNTQTLTINVQEFETQ